MRHSFLRIIISSSLYLQNGLTFTKPLLCWTFPSSCFIFSFSFIIDVHLSFFICLLCSFLFIRYLLLSLPLCVDVSFYVYWFVFLSFLFDADLSYCLAFIPFLFTFFSVLLLFIPFLFIRCSPFLLSYLFSFPFYEMLVFCFILSFPFIPEDTDVSLVTDKKNVFFLFFVLLFFILDCIFLLNGTTADYNIFHSSRIIF